MRAIALLAVLGVAPVCRAGGPFDFTQVKMPAPRRAGMVERFARRLSGGALRHLSHPDGSSRDVEHSPGTITVRWKTSF